MQLDHQSLFSGLYTGWIIHLHAFCTAVPVHERPAAEILHLQSRFNNPHPCVSRAHAIPDQVEYI
jgi:hypothetical protein